MRRVAQEGAREGQALALAAGERHAVLARARCRSPAGSSRMNASASARRGGVADLLVGHARRRTRCSRATVVWKRIGSWSMQRHLARAASASVTSRRSWPSIVTRPCCGIEEAQDQAGERALARAGAARRAPPSPRARCRGRRRAAPGGPARRRRSRSRSATSPRTGGSGRASGRVLDVGLARRARRRRARARPATERDLREVLADALDRAGRGPSGTTGRSVRSPMSRRPSITLQRAQPDEGGRAHGQHGVHDQDEQRLGAVEAQAQGAGSSRCPGGSRRTRALLAAVGLHELDRADRASRCGRRARSPPPSRRSAWPVDAAARGG